MGEELWYVKLANDDVHRVTLDQLDGAFQAGHIDENTMVLAAGAERWAKLGDLLGGGDEEAPPPAAQYAPVLAAPVQQAAYAAPVVSYVPPQSAYPAPAAVPVARAAAVVPNSLRPMSIDLEDNEFETQFRKKSRKGWGVAVVALAAVAGGVGFVATRAHSGGSGLVAAAAAAVMGSPRATEAPVIASPVAPDPSPVVPSLPVAPPPAPTAASNTAPNAVPAEASPMSPHFTDRFNEDQKVKLLAADKDRASKSKGHHASSGGGSPSHASAPKPSKSTTFTTSGNKYDPLNSAI